MVSSEQLKPDRRYFYYRIYCIITVIGWFLLFPLVIHHKNYLWLLPSIAPFTFPAAIMTCSWSVYPLKYSIFGPLKRTPCPNEPLILEGKNSWSSVGMFNMNGFFSFSMLIFSSGIGISFSGTSEVFIPKEYFLAVKKSFWGYYQLKHRSPEIRSPLGFSNKEAFEKIQLMLKN